MVPLLPPERGRPPPGPRQQGCSYHCKVHPPHPPLHKPVPREPDSERSRWAAGRSGRRGEVRVTGRSPSGGHPVNRHSGRVHFKASRPERWRGRGGELGGSPQYLLGDGVRAQRTKPQRAQKELQVRERSARVPGRHAPGLGSSPPPASENCAGRPRRGGCRARAGGGCGAAGVAGLRDNR